MALSLVRRIARIRSAIDVETDPGKLEPLQTRLALALALASASKDDDDEDDKDDDGEESKAKKAAATAAKAKKSAEAAKHRAKAAEHKAKAAESEEAAKKCEEGDEEESEEAAAALPTSTDHTALLASLAHSVTKLEQTQAAGAKAALITGARKLGAITKTEAAWLGDQPLASVESFLGMRSKAGLVITSEDDLVKAKDAKPGTEASLPDYTREMIDASVAAFPGADKKAFRETLVKAHLEEHVKQLAAANSAPGRY